MNGSESAIYRLISNDEMQAPSPVGTLSRPCHFPTHSLTALYNTSDAV